MFFCNHSWHMFTTFPQISSLSKVNVGETFFNWAIISDKILSKTLAPITDIEFYSIIEVALALYDNSYCVYNTSFYVKRFCLMYSS